MRTRVPGQQLRRGSIASHRFVDEQVCIGCEFGNPLAHGGVTADRHGVVVDVDPVADGGLDRVVIDECRAHRPPVVHEDRGRRLGRRERRHRQRRTWWCVGSRLCVERLVVESVQAMLGVPSARPSWGNDREWIVTSRHPSGGCQGRQVADVVAVVMSEQHGAGVEGRARPASRAATAAAVDQHPVSFRDDCGAGTAAIRVGHGGARSQEDHPNHADESGSITVRASSSLIRPVVGGRVGGTRTVRMNV